MLKYVSICLCFVLTSTVTSNGEYPKVTKQYRPDYVYNRKTDAFYKLHIESRHRGAIETVCRAEGAQLMSPRSDHDIVQIHAMLKRYPDLSDHVWVADDGQVHESAEEVPIIHLSEENDRDRGSYRSACDVVSRSGDVQTLPCYRALPFICKVEAKDAPYDPDCRVFSQNYEYFSSVGSCYKIPDIAYTWGEAYSECEAEGAHLVVINSETERSVVQNLTLRATSRATVSCFFSAGFRSLMPPAPREFKTVFNQTLREAGFEEWSPNEPNNANGHEYCGSIFNSNGKYNDIACNHEYGFVCEKEITST